MSRVSIADGFAGDPSASLAFPITPPLSQPAGIEIACRQLRQNTRAILQRVVCLIADSPTLGRTPQSAAFAQDLIGRICLSADLSDSLFDAAPLDGLKSRLLILAKGLVRVFADPAQEIAVEVTAEGNIPSALNHVILRITHELVANAVRHGMHWRGRGRIRVRLTRRGQGPLRLTVSDNGNGFGTPIKHGEGLQLVQALAARHGGGMAISSALETTVAVSIMPQPDLT
jgi:signal transduction histidine kinase